MKRVAILGLFIGVFVAALWGIYILRGESMPKLEAQSELQEPRMVSDSVHSYTVVDVNNVCSAEDKIFCAIERAVKCTLVPELEGCSKEVVPAFILGRPDVAERPTEMSFAITKIKPVAEGADISVYTTSTCNAVWFGLCEGTVVYALSPRAEGWVVTNIYALEN
ncbi:MAG: hypothetical protein NC218_06395 [Acetobacter sp.]|nr:hypothetical protein [Acetobacter sp.]